MAAAALDAGAALVNDVAGFTFDADLAPLCADRNAPVCVMHAQGDPATMQQNPEYDDVVQDVYAFLQARIADLTALGIRKDQIIIDPGHRVREDGWITIWSCCAISQYFTGWDVRSFWVFRANVSLA